MSAETLVRGEISSKKLKLEMYIEWTIQDIFCDAEVDTFYLSPRFSIPGSEWYLRICPNGESKHDSSGWIGLYLMRASEDSIPPINVNYDIGVKKVDGTIENMISNSRALFKNENGGWGPAKFLERSKLSERRFELAPSGAMTVTCSIRVKDTLDFTSRMVELSDDFKNMFFSAEGCDATFKVQNEEFPIHRSVLALRCSVFKRMFEIDMEERREGTVDIVDCDPEAFKDFLVYMYSGQFRISSGNASELYKIAHKYCVEGLKATCVRSILSNLSVDNVIDAAILGDRFDDNELQSKSQDFFDENFFAVVVTDKWISLLENNHSLAEHLLNNAEINTEIKKKKCQDSPKSYPSRPWMFIRRPVRTNRMFPGRSKS